LCPGGGLPGSLIGAPYHATTRPSFVGHLGKFSLVLCDLKWDGYATSRETRWQKIRVCRMLARDPTAENILARLSDLLNYPTRPSPRTRSLGWARTPTTSPPAGCSTARLREARRRGLLLQLPHRRGLASPDRRLNPSAVCLEGPGITPFTRGLGPSCVGRFRALGCIRACSGGVYWSLPGRHQRTISREGRPSFAPLSSGSGS
jgi:hypothetical protein